MTTNSSDTDSSNLPYGRGPIRVGVICDYAEERWASMDLVATMLLRSLELEHRGVVEAIPIRPAMPRRFTRIPILGGSWLAWTADRFIARFLDYPTWLRRLDHKPAIYHIVDHSYAHLVHALPPGRTIVTCHDLDTFRSVLEPEMEPRSRVFRTMTRQILTGLQAAARITCDSIATRDAILAHRLAPANRLDLVYLGVGPVMSPAPDPAADAAVETLLGAPRVDVIDILHVGSTIQRKRIDVLLRVMALVRTRVPAVRLIKVGGAFTPEQGALARSLGLAENATVVIPFLETSMVAAVYRRAALVLQPSEAEGFGLPVAEAMACGVPVVASDIPVLREVGGAGATYCPVGDVAAWSDLVVELLAERTTDRVAWEARRNAALEQASRFSWSAFTSSVVDIYRRVLTGDVGPRSAP